MNEAADTSLGELINSSDSKTTSLRCYGTRACDVITLCVCTHPPESRAWPSLAEHVMYGWRRRRSYGKFTFDLSKTWNSRTQTGLASTQPRVRTRAWRHICVIAYVCTCSCHNWHRHLFCVRFNTTKSLKQWYVTVKYVTKSEMMT